MVEGQQLTIVLCWICWADNQDISADIEFKQLSPKESEDAE